jgi:hypothetical protein
MNNEEFIQEVDKFRDRKLNMERLICFANWVKKECPDEVRKLALKDVRIIINVDGTDKRLKIKKHGELVRYKAERLIWAYKMIVPRLQIDCDREWVE